MEFEAQVVVFHLNLVEGLSGRFLNRFVVGPEAPSQGPFRQRATNGTQGVNGSLLDLRVVVTDQRDKMGNRLLLPQLSAGGGSFIAHGRVVALYSRCEDR